MTSHLPQEEKKENKHNQKMASKTQIDRKLKRKDNPELVKLIIHLKKQKSKFWVSIANLLAFPKRKNKGVNISKINKLTKASDNVIVPSKVLSDGELDHAITLSCMKISHKAKEKLKKATLISIEQMLKQNPEGKGIRIII